jgi:hypothetical protein
MRKPQARTDDLVIEEVEDEVLIYDGKNARAHALTPDAARVWRACDGETSIDDLAVRLELSRDTVVRALGELEGAELLESFGLDIVDVGNGNGITRREMAFRSAKIGTAVAAAPLLYSIAVPSPAAAATPTNFQCELFSINDCGNSAGAGSIKGCCCCCEASNASTPACKLGASDNGCSSFTCFDGKLGKCTGAPGSVPFTNGGCCGLSTTVPDNCGCAWGRTLNGNNTTANGCVLNSHFACPGTPGTGDGQQCITCGDTTSTGPTSNGDGVTPTAGNFVACTSTSITAGTCSAVCCNGTVITPTSPFLCCNDVNPFCCSDPTKCGKVCGTAGSGC